MGESKSYTYDNPQDDPFLIRAIDLAGSATNEEDRFDFLEVEVLEKFSPFAGVATCSNNEILLTLIVDEDTNTTEIDNPFDEFFIEFGDGDTQNFRTPTSGGATVAIPHVYATDGTYTITISGIIDNGDVSDCSVFTHEISTLENLPTPTLTNINVIDQNTLFFYYDQLNPELVYSLQIDDGSGFADIATLDPNSEPTSFELVENNLNSTTQSYQFRIRVSDVCGRIEEFSQTAPNIALDYQLIDITDRFSIQFIWLIESSGFSEAFLYNDPNIVIQSNTHRVTKY